LEGGPEPPFVVSGERVSGERVSGERMDLNQPLFWIGLLGGLVMLVRGLRTLRAGGRSFAIVGLVVLLVAGVAWWLDGAHAGFVAIGAWGLLVVSPALISRRLQRAIDRRDHDRAARLARLLAVVHPSESTRLVALDREVQRRHQRGDVAGAEALLANAASRGALTSKWAAVERLRLGGRWAEIVPTFDTGIDDADLRRLPSLVGVYLRALGELGRRGDMFRAYARFSHRLEGDALTRQRTVVWLVLLAFAGKRGAVDRLLATRLSSFDPALATFWRATADLAGDGDPGGAREMLHGLTRGSDAELARAAARRIAEGPIYRAEPLSMEQEIDCASILRHLDHEDRFGLAGGGRARPVAVLALIVVNTLVYGLEWVVGDPTSDETLYRMGALLSTAVLEGHEGWRLFSCLFLHYGAVHLVMNMLGLWVLGPFVEHALGRARWLFVYLGAGLGGSVVLTVLPALHLGRAELCVGASGSIMGLVGATMAIMLRGLLREKAVVAKRRLLSLGLVVGLQTVFDLATPEVSFTAHASGLVTGLILTSLLTHHASTRTATAKA
jgi:rhomboid protease GluP